MELGEEESDVRRKIIHKLELNSAILKCKIYKLLSLILKDDLRLEVGDRRGSVGEVILSSPRDVHCHGLCLGDVGEDGGKCTAPSTNLFYYYAREDILMRIQIKLYRK